MSNNSLPQVIPPVLGDVIQFHPRLTILTLGDSITQRGSEPDGWVNTLGHYYSRKADVYNRGYSGYNTRHILALLEMHLQHHVFPLKSTSTSLTEQAFATVLLGSNDAAIPGTLAEQQHVPIDEYEQNLHKIIQKFKSFPALQSKEKKKARIFVLTPPPVNDKQWHESVLTRYGSNLPSSSSSSSTTTAANIPVTQSRLNSYTSPYAEVVKRVVAAEDVILVDLYSLIWGDYTGQEINEAQANRLSHYLCDGLHLSAHGNRMLFEEIIKQINKHFPEVSAENLPIDGPTFDKWLPEFKENPIEQLKKYEKGQAQQA